jgi:hypothetical protein
MAQIKLQRLPDRTPVKLTVSLSPELSTNLAQYAAFYASIYGRDEPLAELVPAILASFMGSDRVFQAARRQGRLPRED